MIWKINGKTILIHHGIRGQKWGKRNGPPYPLSTDKHMRVVQRTEKVGTAKSFGSAKRLKTKDFHDTELNSAKNQRNTVNEVLSYINDDNIVTPIEALQKTDWFNINPKNENYKASCQRINPDYGEIGTTNNCVRCSAAFALRRQGYDVVAARSHHGALATEPETWFEGARTKGYASTEEMKRDILKGGDGAYGILNGFFGDGIGSGSGGHAVNYVVNGRHIEIYDSQTGNVYKDFDKAWNNVYSFDNKGCFATRLDNTTPNWSELSNDSVFNVNTKASPYVSSVTDNYAPGSGLERSLKRRWEQNGTYYRNF